MSVTVAQAPLEEWGPPDNPVRAELMVDALAARDAARITPEDSIEWISTVARLTDLPISSVQTTLVEHLAPTPSGADLDALRAATFPHRVTAPNRQHQEVRGRRPAVPPQAISTSSSQTL